MSATAVTACLLLTAVPGGPVALREGHRREEFSVSRWGDKRDGRAGDGKASPGARTTPGRSRRPGADSPAEQGASAQGATWGDGSRLSGARVKIASVSRRPPPRGRETNPTKLVQPAPSWKGAPAPRTTGSISDCRYSAEGPSETLTVSRRVRGNAWRDWPRRRRRRVPTEQGGRRGRGRGRGPGSPGRR